MPLIFASELRILQNWFWRKREFFGIEPSWETGPDGHGALESSFVSKRNLVLNFFFERRTEGFVSWSSLRVTGTTKTFLY